MRLQLTVCIYFITMCYYFPIDQNRHVKFDARWKLIARSSADYFPVVIAAAS